MRGKTGVALCGRLGAAAFVCAAVFACTATAHATPNSFSGSCLFAGVTSVSDDVRLAPQPVEYTIKAERNVGRCDGELNGAPVEYAPAQINVTGPATVGCSTSNGTGAKGTLLFTGGTLTAVDDIEIPVLADIHGAVTEWTIAVRGAEGGNAAGYVTHYDGAQTSDANKCLPGSPEGIRSLTFGMRMETTSPLVGTGVDVPLRLGVSVLAPTREGLLRRGIPVHVGTNAPVTGQIIATIAGRTIAGVAVRYDAVAGGRFAVRLPLTRVGRKLLRTKRAPVIRLTAKARHIAGKTATASKRFRPRGGR